jgi:CheY-like chemotaxis protein
VEDILVAVIDDEPTYVHVISRVLSRNGYRTMAWKPGGDPVAMIRHNQPHVVVLDMHLVEASGANVLQSLRDDPATKHIPVLLCSGASWLLTEQVQRWGIERLATLTKPFDLVDFVNTVQQLVDGSLTQTVAQPMPIA